MRSADRHAGEGTGAPGRRWPARRWSLLLVASMLVGCAVAVVWSRAEVDAVGRRQATTLARQVATGLRERAHRLGHRLADLPPDCSAPSPVDLGGYAVVVDGVVRCSVDLDPGARAAAAWRSGLHFPPDLPGHAVVGVRTAEGLVVGVLPASDLSPGRRVGAPWVLLGPGGDGRPASVVPAASHHEDHPADVAVAVGDGSVVVHPARAGWGATFRPVVLVLVPLLLALALHRRVVVPLGRLADGREPGSACREVGELAATVAAHDAARRELVLGLEETRAEERRRLAVQLHDLPVQELAGANMLLAAMDASGDRSRTGEVRAALRTATAELRRMSSELLPTPVSRVGATRALLDEVHALQDRHPDVRLSVDVHDPVDVDAALSGPLAGLVVRNVVEAVRNALEHAGGRSVQARVALESTPEGRVVRALVVDDGAGLDPAAQDAAEAQGHIGMASMRSLVESAGGTLRVDSAPGAGTTVVLQVPLDDGEAT